MFWTEARHRHADNDIIFIKILHFAQIVKEYTIDA